MIRRLDPRTVGGSALVAAGIVSITAALIATGPTPARAAFVPTPVWLTIHLSDSAGGQYAPGGVVTITATVANSSTTTVGTDFSGSTTTATINAAAHPTVTFQLSTNAVSFVTGSGSYSCNTTPFVACTKATTANKGALNPGSTDTLGVVVSVTGSRGQPADATASVLGGSGEANRAGSSAIATDTANITNSGSYTNEAPPGCFVGKVSPGDQRVENQFAGLAAAVAQRPRIVLPDGTQQMVFQDGSITITINIPPGALPNGTLITLYKAVASCWSAILASTSSSSSTQSFVDGYAAGWVFSGSAISASSSITLSVSGDAKVSAGNTIDKTNKTGISGSVGSAASHAWSVSFTDDPGFVLAQAAAVVTTSSTPSSSSSATTTLAPPAGGGAPVARQASPVPLALGILAIVGGAGLVGTRRRRRPQ